MFACLITLSTKITGGSIPEDQSNHGKEIHADDNENATNQGRSVSVKPRVIYTATGSGVPEVKFYRDLYASILGDIHFDS